MKARVPIAGTVGKSISFDPRAGARAEAAVAALAAQISAGFGGNIRHSALQGLQIGDDHPQYTGNAFPETITGQWNFATIPRIQGETLAEYIEDVVGGSFFDFLQDTTSVVWTYFDTAQHLEANVPPEFVQDTIGAILTDTASIDLVYNDGANTITANIIDEYVQDVVGAMFVDSTSIDFTYNDGANTITAATINANPSGLIGMTAVNGSAATPLRSDGLHAIDPAITPTWTALHTFNGRANFGAVSGQETMSIAGAAGQYTTRMSASSTTGQSFGFYVRAGSNSSDYGLVLNNQAETKGLLYVRGDGMVQVPADNSELQIGLSQDLRFYHDGTNSFIENDTGNLVFKVNGELDLEEVTTSTGVNVPTIGANKPGSAASLTPSTWLTLVVNGTTYYLPLWI